MYTIDEIFDSASEIIVERGEDYYERGMIKSVKMVSDSEYVAVVCGSKGNIYTVNIKTNGEGVMETDCDCPYEGKVCKHIIAVLIAIDNGDFIESSSISSKKADMRTIVENADREALNEFILEYADDDEDFRADFIARFTSSPDKDELGRVKSMVRYAIENNSDADGDVNWRGCNQICETLNEALELAERRGDEGYVEHAFNLAIYVYHECYKLASYADSSSGELSEAIYNAAFLLHGFTENFCGNDEVRDKIYIKLCREALDGVYEGWEDGRYELLSCAADLVTKENSAALVKALDILGNRDDEFLSYYEDNALLVRLKLIQKTEGGKAAINYINSNLDNDAMREKAVELCAEAGNFAEAERLCRERITDNSRACTKWEELLFEICVKSGNMPGQKEAAKMLAITGDFKYYEILKELLQKDGGWEKAYPEIRLAFKQKTDKWTYMKLLSMEREYELLLEMVRENPYAVTEYAPFLVKKYPNETLEIYETVVRMAANDVNSRPQYRNLCGMIRDMADLGGEERAKAVIEYLAEKYPRRKALLDELGKLRMGGER